MAYLYSKKVFFTLFFTLCGVLIALGQTPIPGHAGSLTNGTNGASLNQPNAIFVSGNFAFVASSNALEIVDITDPASPLHKSSLSISDINSVFISGSIAYVTCGGSTNALVMIDVSDVSSPSTVGSLADGTNGALLSNPVAVFVSGNYAYVASYGSNALEVVDVTSPSSPQHFGSLTDGTALLNSPHSVFVSGSNAFVASYGSNALEIVDVSTPSAPAHLGSLANGGSALLQNPTSVFVSGNFAYVTSQGSNALEIIDVTDPTTPVHAASLTDGTNGALISSPQSLFVSGQYCYIASTGSNALEIVNISNPNSPLHAAQLSNGTNGALLSGPQSVFISGSSNNYAFVVGNSNAVEVASVFSPVAPQSTAGSAIGQNQFQANWNISPNASSYFVDVSTDNFSTFVYTNLSASTNSLSITGLNTNTNYQYRVRSSNANGTSVSSSSISVLTITDTPVATSATSVSATGFIANWNSVTGATSYEIDVATDSNFTSFVSGYSNFSVGSNSLAVTGLSAGVSYYYQVRSVNASGSSVSSNAISQITIPANPVAAAASSINEISFTANWGSVTGASGYYLDVATDALFNSMVSGLSNVLVSSNSYSVTGLSGGTTYYYQVRATNAGGTSGNSSAISVLTLPSAPVAIAPTLITQTGFTANWNSVSSATSYRIDVASDAAFTSFVGGYNDFSVATNTISLTSLSSGTVYYYQVRAVNSMGVSVSSNTISQITTPANPSASAASSITQTSFTANWSSVTGASGYFLDVATDAGFSSFVSGYSNLSVSSTSTSVTGLAAGTNYFYRVRATNAGGNSFNSGTISLVTLPNIPVAAGATSVTQSSFTANWSTATGAASYNIDVALDAGFSSLVSGYSNLSVPSNSITITGLLSGTTYYYKVRATNASGSSSSSNVISQITIPSNPVSSSASAIATSSFTANWNSVTGASGYFLDVATDAGFSAIISGYSSFPVSSTSTSVTGLNGGTTYYYQVRSTNAGGTSGNSGTISLTTIPAAPTAIAATLITQTGFTANWNTTTGAASYKIDVALDNGFSSLVSGYSNLSVASNSIAVTGLLSGTTYYYKVRGTNATGSSSSSNVISQITIPANPSPLSASAVAQTSFTANWNSVIGATGYLLDVATDAGFSTIVGSYSNFSVSTNSASVTGLTGGTTYYYRVRATNAGGTSGYSASTVVNTIPAAPVSSAATFISANSFTANWSASLGATGYFLDASSDGTFTSFLSGFNNLSVGNVTSYVVNSSLSPATTYYYRVRAIGPGGTSSNSTIVSLLTPPAVPVATPATSITQTGFTVNWTSVSGATSYSIDIASDVGFTSFVTGYNNFSVASNSTVVTGLNSGITYYYRVRSINSGGSSTSSNTISLITIPPNPSASPASSITQTSFVANWSTTTGATNYSLDVATDAAFNSILSSYNNLSISSTSTTVTGLSGGTTYYYQVRASNTSGTSFNSTSIPVLTIPAAPIASAATAVNLNSFVANWSSVIGASSYAVDVATDNSFTAIIYSNINVGNAFSYNASSLTTGSTYYYRVRAINASGTSTNSNIISTTTQSLASVQASALTFSAVTSGSVAVSFTSGNGSSRIVVVSSGAALSGLPSNGITYNANSIFGNGNALGSGFVVYNGSSTNVTVTGLTAATVYYFQVFEYNGSSGTENYLTTTASNNPLNVATLTSAPTAQPSAIIFSQLTGTSVTVSFTAANPAPTGYLALRAVGSNPNTAPSSGTAYTAGSTLGNATVAYLGSGTSFSDSSLPTNTQYFYSVYSYNGSNSFTNYLTTQPAQASVILDVTPPVISFPNSNPTSANDGSTTTLSVNATDNFNIVSVQLFHRGISESSFTASAAAAGTGGTYSIQTQTSWFDAIGMEYYFIATDENGNSSAVPSTTFYIKIIEASLTYQIPSSKGNGVNDYKIFSFPYNLSSGNSVEAVFPSVASTDISKFRMLWYNPAKKAYDEYALGEFTTVDLSKGYWLLTSNSTSATISNAAAPSFARGELDSIKLLPGWNQIGNPYPVAIKWSDVQNFTGQPSGVDTLSLYVYNSGWAKLKSSETLPAFSGGFVKNATSSPITIYIPFLGQTAKGGRVSSTNSGSDISQLSWQIDLSLFQNGNGNQIGGIGMDPNAHYGMDRFDDSNPPGFKGMPELLFDQKEIAVLDLARSVVPTQSNYTWRFSATGTAGSLAELQWNSNLGEGSEQLMLLDEKTMQVIDMRAQQKYSFDLSNGRSFKIFFGEGVSVTPDEVQLSNAFPNPAVERKSNFILGLPDSNNNYQVNIQVFNSSGVLIDSNSKEYSAGMHQLLWQSNDSLGSGMYFYRLTASDGKRNFSGTVKIIIP